MTNKRHIAVVTGSRADFGLLQPVLRAIGDERRLRLSVVVTGTHLTTGTWRDVAANWTIAARVPMQRRGHGGRGADVAALGRGITGLGKVFARLKPDVVLVLGDRIEALAAGIAAHVGGIHLAHIHGGDRAEGVADEAMRHALSKLTHIHLSATQQSRQRLLRMGENPRRVFQVGSPAMDGLREVVPVDTLPFVVVLQHPIGARPAQERQWMRQTLRATQPYARVLMAPNADPGHTGIQQALRATGEPVVEHLTRQEFLAMVAGASALVGNSSAGLIEAAALGTPCVNIGPRQAGREKPANVIDCGYGVQSVRQALQRALRLCGRRWKHPYGDGQTGPRIARLLATLDLQRVPLRKRNSY